MPGPHSVSAAAQDVVDTVAQLGRAPDMVIGHSFGGKVVKPCIAFLHALF